MAQPIKETPVLEGKDAERFERDIKANESIKVSAEDYQRAVATYQQFKIEVE